VIFFSKMNMNWQHLTLVVLLTGSSQLVHAGDAQRGKQLHDENCTKCHISLVGGDGTGIYVREDRRIDSYSALYNQVKRCKTSLGVPWPEHQIEDVISYLNTKFYKFDVPKEKKADD
jgi:mono/diheme cytochrome c family protein